MELSLADILWRLAGVLALVFANGFFVAAEFSIVTVRKTRIDQLIAEGHRGARAVRRAVTDPDSYIAATQLGITMASIGLGWIGEPALASLIQPALRVPAGADRGRRPRTASPSRSRSPSSPRCTSCSASWRRRRSRSSGRRRPRSVVVKPTELFMKVFWPFIRLLNGMGRAVVNLLGLRSSGRARDGALGRRAEDAGDREPGSGRPRGAGRADAPPRLRLRRSDRRPGDGAAHRARRRSTADASRRGAARADQHAPATRVCRSTATTSTTSSASCTSPIVREGAGGRRARRSTPAALAREALTVPETLGADDLLAEMRRRGVREAIVIDEYGGTAGLVTFESLMERIVGDLGGPARSGRDRRARRTGRPTSTAWRSSTDVNEQFGLHIDEDTYTTVGGYVLGRLGRRARVGDAIEVEGRTMRVVALDGLRVAKVWLSTPHDRTRDRRTRRTEERQRHTGSLTSLSPRAAAAARSRSR